MRRRLFFIPALALAPLIAGTVLARPALAKWPPWLSIEAPVNPFDPATRDAVLLVHTMVHSGTTKVSDLAGCGDLSPAPHPALGEDGERQDHRKRCLRMVPLGVGHDPPLRHGHIDRGREHGR